MLQHYGELMYEEEGRQHFRVLQKCVMQPCDAAVWETCDWLASSVSQLTCQPLYSQGDSCEIKGESWLVGSEDKINER